MVQYSLWQGDPCCLGSGLLSARAPTSSSLTEERRASERAVCILRLLYCLPVWLSARMALFAPRQLAGRQPGEPGALAPSPLTQSFHCIAWYSYSLITDVRSLFSLVLCPYYAHPDSSLSACLSRVPFDRSAFWREKPCMLYYGVKHALCSMLHSFVDLI